VWKTLWIIEIFGALAVAGAGFSALRAMAKAENRVRLGHTEEPVELGLLFQGDRPGETWRKGGFFKK
jgi:hypothetical protein